MFRGRFGTFFELFVPLFKNFSGEYRSVGWVHTKGVMQQHATLGRVLRRFFTGSASEVPLRRVLRRRLVRVSVETGVLRRVLRRVGGP